MAPGTGTARRAKIVCTLGPASGGRIAELVQAGLDIARLNLSHGSRAEHLEVYRRVRSVPKLPRS